MKIYLETNKKYGVGYQLRAVASGADGDPANMEEAWDFEPYTLYNMRRRAVKLLEMLNKKLGTSYKLEDVLVIDRAAIEQNSKRDLASARINKKLRKQEAMIGKAIREAEEQEGKT